MNKTAAIRTAAVLFIYLLPINYYLLLNSEARSFVRVLSRNIASTVRTIPMGKDRIIRSVLARESRPRMK